MASIRIKGFSGVSPRTGPELLQSNQAQVANDTKLQSGEIRAWRNPVLAYTPYTNNVKTIYNLIGASSTAWLEWASVVDVVTGPIADTTDYRIYYTGQGAPKKTNWTLATTSGSGAKPYSYLEMGVPAPTVAPSLSATGGTAPTETRAYCYTYLSTFGALTEESAPSPATLITCNAAGSTVSISGFGTAPFSAGGINYNITGIRIYRVVSGSTTSSYQQVDQIAVTPATGVVVAAGTSSNGVSYTSSTYPDSYSVTQLGVNLPTLTYQPPPSTLTGIVSMPNGMLAGFTSNQVWFCQPYAPHAWPLSYMLTVEFPIVGLGVFENSLVVLTTQNPFLISGTSPAAMSIEKLPMKQPCVSKASIAYDQFGVVYASPNGLVAIGPGVQDIITTPLLTRDEWQPYNPSSMIGLIYNNFYMGFYNNGSPGGVVIARNDNPPMSTFDFPATSVFLQRSTGNIFASSLYDNNVYQLDADTIFNTTYQWQSKRFLQGQPINFAALKVDADFLYLNNAAAYQAAVNQFITENAAIWAAAIGTTILGELNSVQVNKYPINGDSLITNTSAADFRFITVVVYADDNQVFSTSIFNNEPIRMPSGFKSYNWVVAISGNVPVRSFCMATTITELANPSLAAAEEYRTA